MTLTLGTILVAARDRSPWFHRSRVSDAVCARFLSDVQNDLISAANRIDRQYLAQTATIVLAFNGADAPGAVGAGTIGGLPGTVDSNGNFSTTESQAGALVEANVTAAGGAAVFVSERVVTSATTTTLSSTGAGRTTNQDQGRVLVITAGTGIGQRREILSNTAEQWVISTGSDGLTWTTTPDTTSIFDVVVPAYTSDESVGVVTNLPATSTAQAYLVKLSAQGVPYIDFTQPLVATIDAGVPLPSMQFALDGTVWYADGSSGPLEIVNRQRRFAVGNTPAVYIDSQQVFLVGDEGDWTGVSSFCIRYSPIAPVFAALTDVFLLPDDARAVLIAKAAEFMAIRVMGMDGVMLDPSPIAAQAKSAEQSFRASVLAGKRGRHARVAEIW